jgi:glutamine synthetase
VQVLISPVDIAPVIAKPLSLKGNLNQLSQLTENLMKSRTQLDETVHLADKADSDEKRAQLLAEVVSPSMTEVRKVCDELESIVGDTFWPLPKYREMLFLL